MFTWSDDYTVGNDEIDAQHKTFFGIADRFDTVDPADKAAVEKLFDELDDYTETHFKDEEELLAERGFPGLEKHKAVHRVFADQVRDLRTRFRDNELEPGFAGDLVIRWLSIHIKVMDKTWGEWMRVQELANQAPPAVAQDAPPA